mgnify:CR=1 FL=1
MIPFGEEWIMPSLIVATSLVVYAGARLYMSGPGSQTPSWLRYVLAAWHGAILPIGFLYPTEAAVPVAVSSAVVAFVTLAAAVRVRRELGAAHRLAELGAAVAKRPPGIWSVDLDRLERLLDQPPHPRA